MPAGSDRALADTVQLALTDRRLDGTLALPVEVAACLLPATPVAPIVSGRWLVRHSNTAGCSGPIVRSTLVEAGRLAVEVLRMKGKAVAVDPADTCSGVADYTHL